MPSSAAAGSTRRRLPLAALATGARQDPETSEHDRRGLLACALLDETLRSFAQHYAELKRVRGALDFDDLELRARTLLYEHEGVRAAWSERLELMMVDEFQDTNRRQLALLELLEHGNLFTVGDELQSIYGFRYAEVELFRERRAALAAQGAALALTCNFRARPPLIAAVNAVFAARFGDAHTPLLAAREDPHHREPSVELLLTDRRGWAESPHARALAGEAPAGRAALAPGRGASAGSAHRRARASRRGRRWRDRRAVTRGRRPRGI